MRAKVKTITITMKEGVFEKGKILANEHNRSFSNYVEWLILKEPKETQFTLNR